MAKKQTYKPGETCPRSGQYMNTRTRNEVTVSQGETFPPTPGTGQRYILADPTKHKSKR